MTMEQRLRALERAKVTRYATDVIIPAKKPRMPPMTPLYGSAGHAFLIIASRGDADGLAPLPDVQPEGAVTSSWTSIGTIAHDTGKERLSIFRAVITQEMIDSTWSVEATWSNDQEAASAVLVQIWPAQTVVALQDSESGVVADDAPIHIELGDTYGHDWSYSSDAGSHEVGALGMLIPPARAVLTALQIHYGGAGVEWPFGLTPDSPSSSATTWLSNMSGSGAGQDLAVQVKLYDDTDAYMDEQGRLNHTDPASSTQIFGAFQCIAGSLG